MSWIITLNLPEEITTNPNGEDTTDTPADAESTKTNIDRFVKIIEDQVKKAEVARATGTTPRSYGNNGGQLSEFDKRLAKYQ